MSKPLLISVIMPDYNGWALFAQSLPPLLDMKHRGEHEEVIVVDEFH